MRWRLQIAAATLEVVSSIPQANPVLAALFAPYARTSRPPQSRFRLLPHAKGAALWCDEHLLWQGDLAETLAGLEVHVYLRALALLAPTHLSLHGAWFAWGRKAVVVVAPSGGGKSSLATAAVLSGALYGSDEFALLAANGMLEAFPRPLQWGRVRHPAFSHARMRAAGLRKARLCFRDYTGARRMNLWWLPVRVARTPRAPSLIVFAKWVPQGGLEIAPLARAHALAQLVQHLHHQIPAREALRSLHARIPRDARFLRLHFHESMQAVQALRRLLR